MKSEKLFEDFAGKNSAEWRAKIEADLRGKEFETLVSTNDDGIEIQPFYTKESTSVKNQPTKANRGWLIVQEILVLDSKKSNTEALDHLNRGANSLLFYVQHNTNISVLLANIELEHISCHFVVEGDIKEFVSNLNNEINQRGWDTGKLHGSVNIDCLESIARTGNWKNNQEADFEDLKSLSSILPGGFKTTCVNTNLFANSGATLSQQLGIALAMSYEYIHQLDLQSTDSFWINFAVGADYFGEIGKLRAFRRLWFQLQNELGLEQSEVYIYAETAMRNKTILDAYNNQIRTTSEAMSAAIGEANEISVKGFNHTYKEPDFFGERIAKNQQNILTSESHFSKVSDIAQGAYFIEEITEELASKGWDFFKAIEKEGGYIAALKNSWLQNEINKSAGKEQKAFDENTKTLIGANKHAKQDEDLKSLIEQGMFATNAANTTEFEKVVAKRLSEGLEQLKL